MQMWHLPSLPYIYSLVFTYPRVFARSKFVRILGLQPRDKAALLVVLLVVNTMYFFLEEFT